MDPYIRSLPTNNPKAFGQALHQLAKRVLLPSDLLREALPKLSLYLSAGKTRSFSSLHQWVKGILDHSKKRLTDEHWFNLVAYFWKKPGGLSSREEVEHLAACGGPQLVSAMQDENRKAQEFQRLFDNLGLDEILFQCRSIPLDPRYPATGYLLARTELAAIRRTIDENRYQASPIVICGAPGIGKTVLLSQLLQAYPARTETSISGALTPFDYGVLYAPLNQELSFSLVLRSLAQQAGLAFLAHESDANLLYRLRQVLENNPIVMILDGVRDAETARRLIVVNLEISLVMITTNYPDVAQELAKGDEFIIKMKGFTASDAALYYRRVYQQKATVHKQKHIDELVAALDGNPASLVTAFKVANEYGLENAVALVKHAANEPLAGMLDDIFKPQAIAYQNLRSDIYRLRLSVLSRTHRTIASWHEETIAAIFGVDVTVARAILAQMERETQLIRKFPDSPQRWQLHPISARIIPETSIVPDIENWAERALQTESMMEILNRRQKEANALPLWLGWRDYEVDLAERGHSKLWLLWNLLQSPKNVPRRQAIEPLLVDIPDYELLHVESLTRQEKQERVFTSYVLRLMLLAVSSAFFFSGITLIFPFAEKLLDRMLFFAFLVFCLSVLLLFGVWLKGVRNHYWRRDFEWARLRQRLKKYAEARISANRLSQQKPIL